MIPLIFTNAKPAGVSLWIMKMKCGEVAGTWLLDPNLLVLCTPEAQGRAVVLWTSAVDFPNTQVNFVAVEATSAHMAIVLVGIIISHPLPDVASHVVETERAGRIDGFVAAFTQIIGLSVVEADRGGVA